MFTGGRTACFSYDIYACTTFGSVLFYPLGILPLQSDWSVCLSSDRGLDYASSCENDNKYIYIFFFRALLIHEYPPLLACRSTFDIIIGGARL